MDCLQRGNLLKVNRLNCAQVQRSSLICEPPSKRNKMATGLDEPFNFCVVDVRGEVMSYRMRPLGLMSKVINAHCLARGLDQDPQFFYYWNERILSTERADQIRLGAGEEIWHIFMLEFFNLRKCMRWVVAQSGTMVHQDCISRRAWRS
jgi:hypothetical protein